MGDALGPDQAFYDKGWPEIKTTVAGFEQFAELFPAEVLLPGRDIGIG